jgi:hypothetical protein
MSLISDALNKVQLQQQSAGMAFSSHTNSYRRHQPVVRVKSLTFIWANAAILTVFFVAGLIYLRTHSSPAGDVAAPAKLTSAPTAQPPTVVSAPVSSAIATAPSAPKPLAQASSAMEPSTTRAYSAPAPAVSSDYDLAGMSALGNSTLLSISRRSDHRSIWVQVGKSVGEITAICYDPETDSAKISVNGQLTTIRMHDFGSTSAVAAE